MGNATPSDQQMRLFMAESNETSEPDTKWPGVSVSDENKYCIIFLKVHNLKVKKKHGLFGALEATNGEISVKFSKREVVVNVIVNDDSSEPVIYKYKKTLPEEIDEANSSWQIFKEERIKLQLCKSKPGSWQRHAKTLQRRE